MTDGEAGTGLADRLGVRARRRPSPRVGVTVAAAGSALIIAGALVESGNRLAEGSAESPNRWPGVLLSAGVLAAGLFVLARFPRGPLATAGVAATALSVPPLLLLLTIDTGSTPPFSADAVLLVSSIVWLGFYLAGPARAHGLYLGAALFGLWLFVLDQLEGVLAFPFELPATVFGSAVEPSAGGSFTSSVPSATNMGVASLLFGAGYLAAARALDRRGRHGIATPFTAAGLFTTFAGILLLADDLEQLGTGTLLVAAGCVIAILGASAERRATTWIGGIAVFEGAGVLAAKVADDSVDLLAFALAVMGLLAVLVAHLFAAEMQEPDETAPGPSTFSRAATARPAPPPPVLTPPGPQPWGPPMPTEPPTYPPEPPPPA